MDVTGIDSLPGELPILLHYVVPVVGDIKVVVWFGWEQHLLVQAPGMEPLC